MLLTPELLGPFCAATQWFANLPAIRSTAQVERGFRQRIGALLRPVRFPDGTVINPRFTPIEADKADAYRDDKKALHTHLQQLACLPMRSKEPRNWAQAAAPLRAQLNPTLERLLFSATTSFGATGALQLFPSRFGIETTCYLTLAALLEPEAPGRVATCQLRGCNNFIIHAGGVGKPPTHCRGHAQKKRNQERRR